MYHYSLAEIDVDPEPEKMSTEQEALAYFEKWKSLPRGYLGPFPTHKK